MSSLATQCWHHHTTAHLHISRLEGPSPWLWKPMDRLQLYSWVCTRRGVGGRRATVSSASWQPAHALLSILSFKFARLTAKTLQNTDLQTARISNNRSCTRQCCSTCSQQTVTAVDINNRCSWASVLSWSLYQQRCVGRSVLRHSHWFSFVVTKSWLQATSTSKGCASLDCIKCGAECRIFVVTTPAARTLHFTVVV